MSVPLSLTIFKVWFYPLLLCISSVIAHSRHNSLNLCLACVALCLYVCVGGSKCACLVINTIDNNHSVSSIVSMCMSGIVLDMTSIHWDRLSLGKRFTSIMIWSSGPEQTSTHTAAEATYGWMTICYLCCL